MQWNGLCYDCARRENDKVELVWKKVKCPHCGNDVEKEK